MLKGKALTDFINWLIVKDLTDGTYIFNYQSFSCLPETMQQGVLREYFETKNIYFEHQRSEIAGGEIQYAFMILDGDTNLLTPVITATDYNTAFTHAIDKACELWRGE